jgi:hypothetical protein
MELSGQPIAEFLAAVPNGRRRADAHRLIELMRDITGQEPAMWGPSIIGFGTYHYRYDSGREGDSPLAAFSPRKQHLVVYLVSDYADRYASTLARLGPHKASKACLYLKNLDDINVSVLRELIQRSTRVAEGVDRANSDLGEPQRAARFGLRKLKSRSEQDRLPVTGPTFKPAARRDGQLQPSVIRGRGPGTRPTSKAATTSRHLGLIRWSGVLIRSWPGPGVGLGRSTKVCVSGPPYS